ncbi:hypothetical protein C8R46DRAFT_493845 [Mycena filopes]|nr:hypothetical protein C8R46DRAFT_493845 [Mycena filopes]
MLPYTLKLVWCILTVIGTLFSLTTTLAFGSVLGRPWAPRCFCVGLFIYQGSFCLGLIWRMDPFAMPRAFCIAQAILIPMGVFLLGGMCMVLCIAMTLHVVKPKQWGDLDRAFKWRPFYLVPAIGYPLVTSTVYITLIFKYNAVQPTDGMFCDATDPMWVRAIGHTMPAAILSVPTFWLSIISLRRVIRTTRHVERATRDENEVTRQIRRNRHSEHNSFQLSQPPAVLKGDALASPGKDLPPAEHIGIRRLSFRLPFFRQPPRALSPPPSPPADGRSSAASSSFPTFAAITKPGLAKNSTDNRVDVVDRNSPWMDGDSLAPTSIEGHETSDVLEVDKTHEEDDDGTYRLSYRETVRENVREHVATPSRISHLAHVPSQAPQLQRLILVQISFPLALLLYSVSTITELAMHRNRPRAFGTQNVLQMIVAWGPGVVFASLPSVQTQLVEIFAFWRR